MLKDKLDQAGIRYTYASITDNLANLKVFMNYRETLPQFDRIRKEGLVGIPFVVVNRDEAFFFEDDLNLDDLT